MHKLEKLILESYASLLNEMDGGRLFDYFNNTNTKEILQVEEKHLNH